MLPFLLASNLALPPPTPPPLANHRDRHQQLSAIRNLIHSTVKLPPPTLHSHPIDSLRRGDWVKLICGASFEDAADVRNLSLVYTLAGVDCIDCAADESVVNAVRDGIAAAEEIADVRRPWVMVSINDDRRDVHFRKAEFDPGDCPPDCSRPCEMVCPANAISLKRVSVREEISLKRVSVREEISCGSDSVKLQGGVITERCYGCGRCFPVCPYDKIKAMTYMRDPATTSALLKKDYVDAVEIHTSGRHTDFFSDLWRSLGDSVGHVKLVAVSLPDVGESSIDVMNAIYSIMEAHLRCHNLWQLDGRPMSGDIGQGATRKTIAFATRLASILEKPHGFYQLAGGTNSQTVDYLKKVGLFQTMIAPEHHNKTMTVRSVGSQEAFIGGIAYGGYARKVVGRVLQKVSSQHGVVVIEDYPEYLLEALIEALCLVGPVKCYNLH